MMYARTVKGLAAVGSLMNTRAQAGGGYARRSSRISPAAATHWPIHALDALSAYAAAGL